MPPDTSNLILENLVEEPGLKLSLSRRRGSNVTRVLASSKDDELLSCGHGRGIERSVGLIRLERLERGRLNKL